LVGTGFDVSAEDARTHGLAVQHLHGSFPPFLQLALLLPSLGSLPFMAIDLRQIRLEGAGLIIDFDAAAEELLVKLLLDVIFFSLLLSMLKPFDVASREDLARRVVLRMR